MTFYDAEHQKGKMYELQYLPHLRTFFNDDSIENISERFSKFDFKGKNKLIEMKQRNIKSTSYQDTMMPLPKMKYCKEHLDIDIYFVILFTDGLFYWKYDVNSELNYRTGGRSDRLSNEIRDYAYIPMNYFQKIMV